MTATTKTEFTIHEINSAIAVWTQREPTVDAVLCRPARKIADVLGEMIWTKATTVQRSAVKEETLRYLDEALHGPLGQVSNPAG